MATRFYLRNSTASEPKPNVRQSSTTIDAAHWFTSTLGGGQDSATNVYPLDMKMSLGASDAQIGGAITEPGSAHYGHVKLWISPTLSASVTFENTDTFTLVMWAKEGNAAQNMLGRARIYVWKADDTIRAALYSENANGAEASAAGAQVTLYNATALTGGSVACVAGDRIVLELLEYCNNSKTVSYDHLYGFNGASGSAYDSYLEFSKTFEVTGETYSQTVQQGMTVNDRNENPAANVQRLKKRFWMRLRDNAGRPAQGISVNDRNENPAANVQRLKKRFIMTFKNATAGASRGRQSISINEMDDNPTAGLKRMKKRFWMRFTSSNADRLQAKITVGDGDAGKGGKLTVIDIPGAVVKTIALIENTVSGFNGIVDKLVSKKWTYHLSQGITTVATWQPRMKLSAALTVTANYFSRAIFRLTYPQALRVSATWQPLVKIGQGFLILDTFISRASFKKVFPQGVRVTATWQPYVKVATGFLIEATAFTRESFIHTLTQGIEVTATWQPFIRIAQALLVVDEYCKAAVGAVTASIEEAIRITADAVLNGSWYRTRVEELKVVADVRIFQDFICFIEEGFTIDATQLLTGAYYRVAEEALRLTDNVTTGGSKALQLIEQIVMEDFVRKIMHLVFLSGIRISHLLYGLYEVQIIQPIRVSAEYIAPFTAIILEESLYIAGETVKGLARVVAQSVTMSASMKLRIKLVIGQSITVAQTAIKSLYKTLTTEHFYALWSLLAYAYDCETLDGVGHLKEIATGATAYKMSLTATYGVAGKYGNAVELHAAPSFDWGVVDTAMVTNNCNSMTFALWHKPTATGITGNRDLFHHSGIIGLYLLGGVPSFQVNNVPLSWGSAISANEWHLIAGVIDGINSIKISVDGGAFVSRTTGSSSRLLDNIKPYLSGGIKYGYLDGYIDDIMVFTKKKSTLVWVGALTQNELLTLYNSKKGLNLNTSTNRDSSGLGFSDSRRFIVALVRAEQIAVTDVVNTIAEMYRALTQALNLTDIWSRIHDAFRTIEIGVTITDNFTPLSIEVDVETPWFGSFPRPVVEASMLVKLMDSAGVAVSGATATATIYNPSNGGVWDTVDLEETSASGVYVGTIRVKKRDPLASYPVHIDVTYGINHSDIDGFITVYAPAPTAISFH